MVLFKKGDGSAMNEDKQILGSRAQLLELPSDLGRRVRFWRERAGRSREDLAARAGMSAGYLEYLESQPGSMPSSSAIARLASALDTSVTELLGGNVERAPGSGAAARHPHLVELRPEQSWSRLGSAGVGRIVFDSSDGPVALPVNYAVANETILLKTAKDSAIARIPAGSKVSFEVDHIDDAMATGWSVLVYATCQHLDDAEAALRTEALSLDPWAGGTREHWVRLRYRSIVGRSIESAL
jgi:transcriptional regulator with XRE-family HTH domain